MKSQGMGVVLHPKELLENMISPERDVLYKDMVARAESMRQQDVFRKLLIRSSAYELYPYNDDQKQQMIQNQSSCGVIA